MTVDIWGSFQRAGSHPLGHWLHCGLRLGPGDRQVMLSNSHHKKFTRHNLTSSSGLWEKSRPRGLREERSQHSRISSALWSEGALMWRTCWRTTEWSLSVSNTSWRISPRLSLSQTWPGGRRSALRRKSAERERVVRKRTNLETARVQTYIFYIYKYHYCGE